MSFYVSDQSLKPLRQFKEHLKAEQKQVSIKEYKKIFLLDFDKRNPRSTEKKKEDEEVGLNSKRAEKKLKNEMKIAEKRKNFFVKRENFFKGL